jgi:hypothetical protein
VLAQIWRVDDANAEGDLALEALSSKNAYRSGLDLVRTIKIS